MVSGELVAGETSYRDWLYNSIRAGKSVGSSRRRRYWIGSGGFRFGVSAVGAVQPSVEGEGRLRPQAAGDADRLLQTYRYP